MKKYIILTLAVFVSACSGQENYSIDPTLLPAPTRQGANTFGCLIDGWVYTSGRYASPQAVYCPADEEGNGLPVMIIKARVGEDAFIRFRIINPEEKEISIYSTPDGTVKETNTYTDAVFVTGGDTLELGEGTVNITGFRKERQIISGTFEGEGMKEGRFDIKYTESHFTCPSARYQCRSVSFPCNRRTDTETKG